MYKILDNMSALQKDQLSFLQKVIDSINTALSVRNLNASELQKIIFNISIEHQNNINSDGNEIENLRDSLIDLIEDDEAVSYLITKLHDYQARYFASSFLGWHGDRAKIALSKLINLASGHGSAAGAAQKAVLFIGGAEKEILSGVKDALNIEDDESFRHLSDLATKTSLNGSDDFFEIMIIGAENKNPNIRETVADVICRLNMDDKEKTKSILVLLSTDINEVVKDAALTALDSLK